MLTMTMTADEMDRHYMRDKEDASAFLNHKYNEWEKYRKRMPKKLLFSRAGRWFNKKRNQWYTYAFFNNDIKDKDVRPCMFLAEIKDKTRTFYVRQKNPADLQIVLFSNHLFDRFAERMGFPRLYPSVIGRYVSRNYIEQCLWKNEDGTKVVYAVTDGIVLGDVNHKTHVCTYRTFVSKDMLKPTQRKAYDEVVDTINFSKQIISLLGQDAWEDNWERIASEAFKPFTAIASEIYNEFYE